MKGEEVRMVDHASAFDTAFGMLHSLTTLKSECERIVNDARHAIANVAEGLECGQLPSHRAVEILRDVEVNLSRLAR
jgi:hypothetical protein